MKSPIFNLQRLVPTLRFIISVLGSLTVVTTAVAASTNDLASTLQKGLFEEEANRNFPAAIEAYQSVINRFDDDRKLAATAIFRLGEIYRKQGKTNEATAQYERVVREFSDQSQLVTSSQSYLAASAALPGNATTTNVSSESAPTSDEAEEVKKIRAMIRDSPDLINAKDQSGLAPLHTAARDGHLIVTRFLVENGGDPNVRDNTGLTPLHWAALFGHKAVVELLLSHGANLKAIDSDGATPLYIAAKKGFRSVVEVLLARGADVNAKTKSDSTPLHIAVANGFKSVAELLLNHNADVNANSPDTRLFAGGTTFNGTALHIAAARGDLAIAELLFEQKAKVDLVNNEGETPLALAAKNGKVEFISLLLSHGADVNFRNPVDRGYKDWAPLHYAVYARKKEAVALLLKNGADPNAKIGSSGKVGGGGLYVSKGCTPLIIAALQDDVEILASLLDAKADPNLQDDRGLTPAVATLHIWHTPDGKRMLSLLLDHGANTETPDIEGKTLLMEAAERENKEIVEMLLAHKANVNAQNPHGDSPLHFVISALYRGPYDAVPAIAELLLSAGADVNLQNKEGRTPLNHLLNFGQPSSTDPHFPYYSKLLELLHAHGAIADVPRLDAIQVRRPEANFYRTIFTKGTNGWDQFTLFDLIGVQYTLLSASPAGDHREIKPVYRGFGSGTGLDFPDFKRLRIRHPKPDFKGWDERTIDIDSALAAGDCSADILLQMGDHLEIREADHVLNAGWEGLSTNVLKTLQKCLARNVSVIVKGESHSISLGPDVRFAGEPHRYLHGVKLPNAEVLQFASIMIKPALIESKLLLASSDLSRIKLIRTDPATGQKRELIVDCSEGKSAPSVWLRDGDVIEVPDKP